MAKQKGTMLKAVMPAYFKQVPDDALSLPWTRYPRDPQTARSVAVMLEHAAGDKAVRALGPEAVAFFSSHAEYLHELATRADRQHPEPVTVPVRARAIQSIRRG